VGDLRLSLLFSIVFGNFLYFQKHSGFVPSFLQFSVPTVPLTDNLPMTVAGEEVPSTTPASPPCALSGFIFHPIGGKANLPSAL
jgi:hypothetical protein